MVKWYKRIKGITTPIRLRKDLEEGAWTRCPKCKSIILAEDAERNFYVCKCGHHFRIDSEQYFKILFDHSEYQTLFNNILPKDALKFTDIQSYEERLRLMQEKTELIEAATVGKGKLWNQEVVMVGMNFSFIAGSMGSVMGEKIARAVDECIKQQYPLIMISKSGGARLMESSYALMQMTKVSVKLNQLSEKGIPFISVLTDPTIGGVASIGMLGDVVIAEPDALIGYASPKVVKESMGKDLKKGFQRSEFLFENGFLDFIVQRNELKEKLHTLLSHMAVS